MKRILALLCLMALMAVLPACGKKEAVSATPEGVIGELRFAETENVSDFVKIEMADGGIILMELYPDIAPITVNNFQNLVSDHFYDGIIFHRVIYGFMIQGGDPDGNGIGNSDTTIKGEFSANGVENNLKHTRGVLSMARTGQSYNSASTQFFIMHYDAPHLDGKYAAFGRVIAGMDVVDRIASTPVSNSRPIKEQKMNTVRFVTVTAANAS
jgi:peptidyl-prolyl cis-trans isomerase B (cyclophilin B)